MSTLVILLSVTLFITTGRAWDDGQDWNPWNDVYSRNLGPYYDFHQSSQPLGDADFYPEYLEGRSHILKRPPSTPAFYPLFKNEGNDEVNKGNSRFIGTAFVASLLQPFPNLANRLPYIGNPNFVGPVRNAYTCTGTNGETGICASRIGCTLGGGQSTGPCILGLGVCCINVISTCDGSSAVVINNTYWQAPTAGVTSSSSCSLTIAPATFPVVQPKPICQIRLDFVSFSIDQPDATDLSVCKNDNFQVGGAVNTVPTICGDNNGQHMYLEIPPTTGNIASSTPSGVKLVFTFGATAPAAPRKWNIKISMLPCGASYLAPSDCLQYFTGLTGKVSSFNYKDDNTKTYQLANQKYNICFRTELISSQKASQICLKVCAGTTPFSLTTAVADVAVTGTVLGDTGCTSDFILFNAGTDGTNTADRYCGGAFSPLGSGTSVEACSSIRPFKITYSTDKDETTLTADMKNVGFCFDFQEKQ